MNKLEALSAWCERYYEATNIKVHPQNVPVEILLDEILLANTTLHRMVKELRHEVAQNAKDLLEVTQLINELLSQKEDKKTKKEVKK